MASCFQVGKLGLWPSAGRKPSLLCSDVGHLASGRRFPTRLHVRCRLKNGDDEPKGEEPPESLFMKELRRRGMSPTSLLEEDGRTSYGAIEDEDTMKEKRGDFSRRSAVSTDYEKSLTEQRQRSMALNSEGLEGLIPRAKLLLTIGGTFFVGFGPLILVTVASFSALYLYFGASFVHDASKVPITPPTYIDPYKLLEDERLSRPAPGIN
ncbi:uncharacterized protein LOC116252675 [Nymphaea colorata]|nr:uncharacterized protein LOC116252675 [Nymphaea colorata]